MSEEDISLRPIPDWFWITLLIGLMIVFVVSVDYLLKDLGMLITQALFAGAASTIAILSYRYTVRSNIRETLDQLEPITLENRQIQPILYDIRWRPRFMIKAHEHSPQRLKRHIEERFLPRTAIKLKIYHADSDKRHPVDMNQFAKERISSEMFEDPEVIYEDSTARPINIDIHNADIDTEGIHIACISTNEKEIRRVTDHAMRRITDEILGDTENRPQATS